MKTPLARTVAGLGLGLILISSSAPRGALVSEGPAKPGEIRSQLAAEEYDAALVSVRLSLEYEPDNLELLELAADVAEGMDDYDLSIWYLRMAQNLLEGEEELDDAMTAAVERLNARVADLDLVASSSAELFEKYEVFASELFNLGRSCASRKMYLNAVDLFARCNGTRLGNRANKELDKIYSNAKAATILSESGVDVPVRERSARELRLLAQRDAKHADWENAYRKKTSNYEIKTNMGFETFESIQIAMEQMNRFYRKVFKPKGKPKKMELRVYSSRQEFDRYEGAELRRPIDENIRGFFSPSRNYVATYDPATDGRPATALWSTLFHEASHQFTEDVSKGRTIPVWLNEGTASYFEGARLLPNRSVQTNDIPTGRLRNLRLLMEKGQPTLRDVVTMFQDGSYPGEYYPFGWGLGYFLHNYEDDQCERVYLKPYQDFLNSYRREKKHNVFERFEDTFIKKPKQAGVENFAEFEKRFKEWIYELHDNYFGPPERVENWLARARKQLSYKKKEAARESYRYALRKRGTDLAALFEMGELLASQKEKDAAIYHFRKVLRAARRLEDQDPVAYLEGVSVGDLVERTHQRLAKLDKNLAAGILSATNGYKDASIEAAEAYLEGGLPRQGLAILDDAMQLLGRDLGLLAAKDEIARIAEVDVRRWRRPRISAELEDWRNTSNWMPYADGIGLKEDDATSIRPLYYQQAMPSTYYLEMSIRMPVFAGVLIGASNQNTPKLLTVTPAGLSLDEFAVGEGAGGVSLGGNLIHKLKTGLPKELKLGLKVSPDGLEIFVDGESVAIEAIEESQLRGQIGLFAGLALTRFSDIRLLY